MRVAFYAPLKSPRHPIPSGDRRVANLLLHALDKVGFDVTLASELRLRATPETQRSLYEQAMKEAGKLLDLYYHHPEKRPEIWFTYHHYYKAVDWLGDCIARQLHIPYILAEASHAPKRSKGDWQFNHDGAEKILTHARKIFCLNKADKECLRQIVPDDHLVDLPPFLDVGAFAPSLHNRDEMRALLARERGLDPKRVWCLAVGMMRHGDKLRSYQFLGNALRWVATQTEKPLLIVVGDGEAKDEVQQALHGIDCCFLGEMPGNRLPAIYRAADLFTWPAINEAFGMALLEAQACGLPVLAGDFGGVAGIVKDKETGFITIPGDTGAFQAGLLQLVQDHALRQKMGEQARIRVLREHDIGEATRVLKDHLSDKSLFHKGERPKPSFSS